MNYKKEINVNSSIDSVFSAIYEMVDSWWGKVSNPAEKEGDTFSIFFGDTEWKFMVSHIEKCKRVVWKCVYAKHVHEGYSDIEQEWLNTIVVWELEAISQKKTRISFEHKGLTPDLNCFDICESGWTFFIETSLKNFLEQGIGNPSN